MSFKAPRDEAQPKVQSERDAATGDWSFAAFDALSDGVILISDALEVEFVNRAAASMNGLDGQAVTGMHLSEIVRQSSIDWTAISEAVEVGKKAEIFSQNSNGRPFLTSLRTVRGRDGRNHSILISQRDLEVFDHIRRKATSGHSENTFRFLNDRGLRPDFARQRALSTELDNVLSKGERAISQGARVLLLGESGVGKTEVARYLSHFLNEKTAPFVHVNCGAIPESLFESEVFGYERGSFTGALQGGKRGLIEEADGGMLFLDEIGEIPLTVQAKLLKFLEDGTVQRIGTGKPKAVRVKVISATNRDLARMVDEGRFRKDLYYRLAVIPLEVCPLRRTPQLIGHLVDRFLQLINQRRLGRLDISPTCREKLLSYAYPGNIRELHNIIQHLSVSAERVADVKHLPDTVLLENAAGPDAERAREDGSQYAALKERVRAYELQIIEDAIARLGSKRKAAEALGVDIGTIVRKTQTRH